MVHYSFKIPEIHYRLKTYSIPDSNILKDSVQLKHCLGKLDSAIEIKVKIMTFWLVLQLLTMP